METGGEIGVIHMSFPFRFHASAPSHVACRCCRSRCRANTCLSLPSACVRQLA
jgi:hypothetical protein